MQELEEDIIFGRLRPFERLTEEDVMERFGLTRHMSRQALLQLRTIGIVTQDRGGTIVKDFSLDEVEKVYEVRELLQRHAFERMPLPITADLSTALEDIHVQYCGAVERRDLRQVFRLNDAFHNAIFDACGNSVLSDAIKKYTWLTHGVRSRVFGDPEHLARACAEHFEFIAALRAGDREKLKALNARHINRPKVAYAASLQWSQSAVNN